MKHITRSLDFSSISSSVVSLAAVVFISSCVTQPRPPPSSTPAAPEKPKPLYDWNGKGRTVSRVTINVDEQKVLVFSGKEQIGWATVATGLVKYPTPTGDYKVIEKVADKKSNLFGKTYNRSGKLVNSDAKMGRDPIPDGGRFEGATMSYYMRLTGDGVGMHAGPIPRPGHRASHGCIRMPRAFAPLVFASIAVGTPVSIVGDGPSYADYMKTQQAAAARLYAARKKKAEAKAAAEQPGTQPAAPGSAAVATPEPKPAAAPAPSAPALKEPAPEIKPAIVPASSGQ